MAKTTKSLDIPVTAKMLYAVRDEMNSKFLSLEHKLGSHDKRFCGVDARFDQVDERFKQVDARFDQVDERFKQVDARFKQVDARFESLEKKIDSNHERLMAEIHKVVLISEEQRNQNRMVMDLLTSLYERQDRVEKLLANS